MTRVLTGLEVFLQSSPPKDLKRVGLICQNASQLPDGSRSLDALLHGGVKINALFGPEHGFYGQAADGASVANSTEPHTGLPIFSLYGEHRAPTRSMLKNIDTLIVDMQDVGVRFYTYLSTLFHSLRSAAENQRKIIVLDRPNPLGCTKPAGPMLKPGFESFVGVVPMPIQPALTIGEFANWINTAHGINADLTVIPMKGWKRNMTFEQTGLPWRPTSPAMHTVDTVRVYPGTCQFEGTNLSEGRGTMHPFEVIGAPWIDNLDLANRLNEANLPGVVFDPATFRPASSKHHGTECYGVRINIMDRTAYQPIRTGLHILIAARSQHPANFEFLKPIKEGSNPHYDLIMGSNSIRNQVIDGASADEIIKDWAPDLRKFKSQVKPFHLYPQENA